MLQSIILCISLLLTLISVKFLLSDLFWYIKHPEKLDLNPLLITGSLSIIFYSYFYYLNLLNYAFNK